MPPIQEYLGLSHLKGNIAILKIAAAGTGSIHPAAYDEVVTLHQPNSPPRLGRIIQIENDTAVILVYEGTAGLSLTTTQTRLSGGPMEISLSPEILGRIFDGIGRPADGLGQILAHERREISGKPIIPINPTHRQYPRNYIHTGISAIDGLTTLIRGQKLPIFSADGLPHNQLAAQIAAQASITGTSHPSEKFAVVFAAMGISHDTAECFRKSFTESGAGTHTVMFLNLSHHPTAERIATPRFALTAAEYLAFTLGYHVLTILTDMTAYAEALREISSNRGEIPSRKGYPGYMYSDLASIYERAGIIKGCPGSLTQIPILTMPSDDITHPIPDLTGYITEGQIVLDRTLHLQGIYPPINPLPSLSRLMKDGIGEGFTTKAHPHIAKKLFAAYAKVGDARALASVIGESDLSPEDKGLLEFGTQFEQAFLNQGEYKNRSLAETLQMGEILCMK